MIDKNNLILLHGGLMGFVWLVAVPFAVGANIYGRKKNKTWGTKIHMIVMATAAFLPFTISGLIALTVSEKARFTPHTGIGTILTIGAWIQMILGATNHYLFRYRLKTNRLPNGRPWNNQIHIWVGRILMILGFINIPLGMKMKRLDQTIFILYAVWISLIIIVFIGLIWMKQEGIQKMKEDIIPVDDDQQKKS